MKLKSFASHLAVHVAGEAVSATTSFAVGTGGVWDIQATPVGVLVRRHREPLVGNMVQLSDVLITEGGWGVVEKTDPPSAGKKGTGR